MRVRGAARPWARTIELPTLVLTAVIYGGWLALTAWHAALPVAVLAVAGGWLSAWHNSLQHETIHGHPTRSRAINTAIGWPPINLWLPYGIYYRSHVAHHSARTITDPFDDPESKYVAQEGTWLWWSERVQQTLLGRLVLGPPIAVVRFLIEELARLPKEPALFARDWVPHGLGVAVILGWLHWCGLGLGTYFLCFVYPGTALSLLRSYAEHRADPDPARRAATVERGGLLALLYLNNNLHAAHHARPELAWYRLPRFQAERQETLAGQKAGTGGPVYPSYGALLRRFALRAHDDLLHPDHRRPEPSAQG
ncbi:fatty acid desaturase [Novosphingobium fuchskuhlense]|uniref:Fatty acid desaturase n=1 Tax=Novosphingobium fuchskuhlense TaxID=1117702 RepID=A0A117UXV9_9SPHN|nr:fatty acid desaturase [Novosphingobium fuchskuhlense]KUR72863.1 fatty acid desaturase [Novosphingobium fuchskuhlense]